MKPFVWNRYPEKMRLKLKELKFAGILTLEEAEARQLLLKKGEVGEKALGNWAKIYALVDPDEGIFLSCRYQAFADSALVAALDATCQFIEGKNYLQAQRITGEIIEQLLTDEKGEPFPDELKEHINLAILCVDALTASCEGIPTPSTPLPMPGVFNASCIEGFETLSKEQKIKAIEGVIAQDIRPFIELDQGGIEIKDLTGYKLTVTYAGACTSCPSSIGGTLSYITKVLREKVHPNIEVEPDLEALASLYESQASLH